MPNLYVTHYVRTAFTDWRPLSISFLLRAYEDEQKAVVTMVRNQGAMKVYRLHWMVGLVYNESREGVKV